jgi:hypothetical protein
MADLQLPTLRLAMPLKRQLRDDLQAAENPLPFPSSERKSGKLQIFIYLSNDFTAIIYFLLIVSKLLKY